MEQKKRILQIDEIKRKILICLDKFGTSEIKFGKLIQKLKDNGLSEDIVKKYIGILFDDDFIDINSKVFQKNHFLQEMFKVFSTGKEGKLGV